MTSYISFIVFSRSMTSTEANYSTIELELLALVWGIEKSKYYLYGSPKFTAVVDHRPLLGLFQKDLQDVKNARLLQCVHFVVGPPS